LFFKYFWYDFGYDLADHEHLQALNGISVKTNPKSKENKYLPTKINELFGKGLFAGNKIVEICKPRLT